MSIAAIVGTSMGAVIGGIYASGYSATAEMKEIISDLDMMEIIQQVIGGSCRYKLQQTSFKAVSAIFNVFMDEKKAAEQPGHAPRQGPIFFP